MASSTKGRRNATSAFVSPDSLRPKAKSAPKGKRAAKSAVLRVMDAFSIGVYGGGAGTAKPRKITGGKRKKDGLYRFNGPYTADEVLQLARTNADFGEMLVALTVAPFLSNSGKQEEARKMLRMSPSHADAYVVAWADKIISLDPDGGFATSPSVPKAAMNVASILAETADKAEVNPLDLYRMFHVVMAASVVHAFPMNIQRGVFGDATGDDLQPAKVMSKARDTIGRYTGFAQTIKAAVARFDKASEKSFRFAATVLKNTLDAESFSGFSFLRNAKPMKVPRSIPSRVGIEYGRKNPVLGFQVIEFEYEIDVDVEADGKPKSSRVATHLTSAVELGRRVGNAAEYNGALNGQKTFTPAGRLFLCYSEATNSIFFATDRSPARRVLLAGETSENDAVVFGLDPFAPLTGYTI